MLSDNRVISKVYVLQEADLTGQSIVKICSNRKLAEHYKRILEPKYKEAFDLELIITEFPFVYLKSEIQSDE